MKKIWLVQQTWANEEKWETLYTEESEEDAIRDVNRAIRSQEGHYFKYRVREITLYKH